MVDRQDLFAGYCAVWEYAESRLGYEVHEGPDMQDVCMSDVKEINICSRKGIEKKLYGLLHECGHALIRENWTKFQKEFPAHAACGYDGRKNRTDNYRISLVHALKGQKHKVQCLMSYMHWAVGQYD